MRGRYFLPMQGGGRSLERVGGLVSLVRGTTAVGLTPTSLSVRAATFLGFAVGVLLLVGSIGLAVRERSQKQLALDNQLTTAVTQESASLREYFLRARAIMLLTSHSPAFKEFYDLPGDRLKKVKTSGPVMGKINEALTYLERLYPNSIGEACFIDRTGPENARVVRGDRAAVSDLSPDESGNPFFRPTFALRPGQVYQAKPYVSPDTGEWVISNSTPLAGAGSVAPAIVHFEITLESFRREAAAVARSFDMTIVDADTGRVVVDSRFPQRVGAPLGRPADRRFASLVASGASSGTETIERHRSAFLRLAPIPGNANDWYVVGAQPKAVGSFLTDLGPAPLGMGAGALALLLLAGAGVRSSRRTLQIAAHTDLLTGLHNRRQLIADLGDACERAAKDGRFGFVLFDLDGFKTYNDTFGHLPGDALLRRLAQKLEAAVDGWGRAYRLGGDEFCVLAPLREDEGVERTAAVGEAALSERGLGFAVGASSGGVLLPLEATTTSDALSMADLRMYARKNGGRPSPARQTADVLVRVLHERSELLGPHSEDVANLAVDIGQRLGLPEHRLETLRQAAVLHDVGKIAIPDEILNKPGKLTNDEWGLIRDHTLIGERILSPAPALLEVATIIRATHERMDGTGYPDGFVGEAIRMEARIIAAADAYCAMTAMRPYATPRSVEGALDELRRCAGTQFDPAVVEGLAAALGVRSPTQATGATAAAIR